MLRSFLKFSIILLAVVGLLIFFHYIKILSPLENFILGVLSPVQERIYNLGGKITQEKDNRELHDEISRLISENTKLKILEEENEILKKKLNFLEENQYNYVIARVIGKDPVMPNVLILNRGEESGIHIGFPVVINEGVLIGKIIKTEKKISTFLLLTDSQSKIAATILNTNETKTSRAAGIITGEHGLSIKMEFISQGEEINEGDIIMTSGLEKDIPEGLVIGKVDQIAEETGAMFQSAVVKPLGEFDDLSIVAILLP